MLIKLIPKPNRKTDKKIIIPLRTFLLKKRKAKNKVLINPIDKYDDLRVNPSSNDMKMKKRIILQRVR